MPTITEKLKALRSQAAGLIKSTTDGRAELPAIALDKGLDAAARQRSKLDKLEAELADTQAAIAEAERREQDQAEAERLKQLDETRAQLETLGEERAKIAASFDEQLAKLENAWLAYERKTKEVEALSKALPEKSAVRSVATRKHLVAAAVATSAPRLARAIGLRPPMRNHRSYRLGDVL